MSEKSECGTTSASCCCGPGASAQKPPEIETLRCVQGSVETANGPVPAIRADLSFADHLGNWASRWGVGRNSHLVPPGLFALGNPTAESPVLVSANYKLSFDVLRSSLDNLAAWILVLDTKGINVWCAAGKGTFGTDELVRQVQRAQLDKVVSHRTIVLPQLGAPGVDSHAARRATGFKVQYGPVRAADIPAFLAAGMEATPDMRRIGFSTWERVKLIPVELVQAVRYSVLIGLAFLLASGLGTDGFSVGRLLTVGLPSMGFILAVTLLASALVPALLPVLPGRMFALKGAWVGLATAGLATLTAMGMPELRAQWLGLVAWWLILPAIASFIAMNFTGASTFTSLSGVRREMRTFVPLQAVAAGLGVVMWIAGRFVG